MLSEATMTEVTRILEIYYSMFLIVVGTVCNILSFVVLSRATYRHTTFSIYCRFLAIIDLLTLLDGLISQFVYGAFDFDLYKTNQIVCKISRFAMATFPDISAWILVAMTTERFVSIIQPLKVRSWFSRRNVVIILAVISVSIMLLNLPLPLTFGDLVTEDENGEPVVLHCVMNVPDMEYFSTHIWYWIDLLKFVFLPSSILSILNAVIIREVTRRRKTLTQLGSVSNICTISPIVPTRRPAASEHIKDNPLTVTLVVVNVTFILLNSPISIYLIGSEHWFSPDFGPKERLVFACCISAMYTNNAANFLLYCVTGSKFRAEFCRMLRMRGCQGSGLCRRRRGVATSASVVTRPGNNAQTVVSNAVPSATC